MVQINNVYDRTIALLASQFRSKKANGDFTNFQKVIRALCSEAQELQDVLQELKTERWLSTAIGLQLDNIGEILGLERNPDESDENYRERLQFQIFINTSSGTPEDIMQALKFLTKATHVGYIDVYPAYFQLETNGLNFPNPASELNEAIFRISPAGVNYAPIVCTLNVPIPFIFAGDFIQNPLAVVPDSTELQLLIEPQNQVLYVNAGNTEELGNEGGYDELGYSQDIAGQIAELIQINGGI